VIPHIGAIPWPDDIAELGVYRVTVGGGRKLRYRGRERNEHWWLITGATYNIIRIANLDTTN
jgi:hypothetical protein